MSLRIAWDSLDYTERDPVSKQKTNKKAKPCFQTQSYFEIWRLGLRPVTPYGAWLSHYGRGASAAGRTKGRGFAKGLQEPITTACVVIDGQKGLLEYLVIII